MKPLFLFLHLCFLFGLNTLQAQTNHNKPFTILEYGFPPSDEYLTVRRSVDSLWNIRHEFIAGCLVTSEFEDSVQILNDKTNQQLAKKYGNDWEKRYESVLKDSVKSARDRNELIFTSSISVQNEWIVETSEQNTSKSKLILSYLLKDTNQRIALEENQIATIKNLEKSNLNLIYRGYDNLFEIKVNDLNAEYNFNCIECSIHKTHLTNTLTPFEFVIRIKYGEQNHPALIISNDKGDTSVFQFQKANLPQKNIYLNQYSDQEKLDVSKLDSILILNVDYPLETGFRVEKSEVLSWEIYIKDDTLDIYKGLGSLLPNEIYSKIKRLNSGSEISVVCIAKGSDKILRKKTALFKIL